MQNSCANLEKLLKKISECEEIAETRHEKSPKDDGAIIVKSGTLEYSLLETPLE